MLILIYPSARGLDVIKGAICRAFQGESIGMRMCVGLPAANAADLVQWLEGYKHGRKIAVYPERPEQGLTFVQASNAVFDRAIQLFAPADDDLVGWWSDDFFPESSRWDEQLCDEVAEYPDKGLFQPDDGIQQDQTSAATIPFGRYRWWRDVNGGYFWPPVYRRFVCDLEIARKACARGEYQVLPGLKIMHRHWMTGGRPRDQLDAAGDAVHQEDIRIFRERTTLGFPAL